MPAGPETALAAKAIEAGIKTADGVILRLLGPAAEELGSMLLERIQKYRLKNMERTLGRATQILEQSGQVPEPIPDKLLLPLLEGASLEGDEALAEKWAGLIASAAAGASQSSVHPAFAKVLSEMTPTEASLLDSLAERGFEQAWASFKAERMASMN